MTLLRKFQALLIGIAIGTPLGYLQGSAVINFFRIVEGSAVGGMAGQAYSLLDSTIAAYGIWAYIGASALKGLLLFFLFPAESVTPIYVLQTASSPLEVAGIVLVGALTITLANFVVYLVSRLAGERFVSNRGSRKWRLVEWLVVDHGRFSMYFLRIVPWIGGWAAIPAGIARLNVRTFLVYSFLGFLTYEGLLGFAAYYGLKAGTPISSLPLIPGLF
ncbi:MAG: DedA family protein [Candidatus Nanohaloarchaea archaeon]